MLLEVNKIDVFYGDIQVLKEVSLEIERGQIVSLLGSNGAGKTTLANAICSLIGIAAGEIIFLGERIDGMKPHLIFQRGIAQIPEGREIFGTMTVLENLKLGSYLKKAKKSRKENLDKVFSLFPVLQKRQKQLAGTMSGGEQQMLAIARALMAFPKLLILDEPSLGLSPLLVEEVFNTIERINKEEMTVLLVEQNVYASLVLSKRGYVLENGKVVLQGIGEELLNNDYVKEAYLGI